MIEIERLRQALNDAQAIIIGAGSGLSTSAGFVYDGERFAKYFSDFETKYNFHDMYSGGFYPFESPCEFWAFWSRNIFINRYNDPPKPVYNDLLRLVRDKNYFVITTNVDHCFQKAGFDKSRLFYTQGDYGLFQCSLPCHEKTYDNESIIIKMVESQQNMKVPEELLPVCPVCGRPMTMNLRTDDKFVEDEGWHKAGNNYSEFLDANHDNKTLFLDLGTGMNTPGIIKFPFWRMTREWPDALYCSITLGKEELLSHAEISSRSFCINQDIGEVLQKLL
ncbi:MAG: Sir2 silent information regulator family NAD-dependent deacetylase [Synergistaceae bacterium]|nr:Sir2 silent information regulator family NAD-dependent deacetylase [Synergistaceae bacterium]